MSRTLAVVALGAAALHAVAAGVSLLLVLAWGMPLVATPGERLGFGLANPGPWRAMWGLWMLASASLVALYATLTPGGPLGRMALALASAGLAVDLSTGSLLLATLPSLEPSLARGLLPWANAAALVVANALYSVGGILVVAALARSEMMPRALLWASAPAWAMGLALSLAALAGWPWGEAVAAVAVALAVTPWMAAVGLRAWRPQGR